MFFFVVGLQFNDPLKEDLEMFKENQHFRYYQDITEAKTVLDYINTNSAAKHKHQVRIRREVNLKYPCWNEHWNHNTIVQRIIYIF